MFRQFYIILALKIHKTRNNFLIITPEIYFQSLLSLFDIRNLSPKLRAVKCFATRAIYEAALQNGPTVSRESFLIKDSLKRAHRFIAAVSLLLQICYP